MCNNVLSQDRSAHAKKSVINREGQQKTLEYQVRVGMKPQQSVSLLDIMVGYPSWLETS